MKIGAGWGCLLVAVVALGAITVACGFEAGYLPTRAFDAITWRSVQRSDDATRLQMVESLIRSGKLNGLTHEQVVRLLGPDCDCDYFDDWDLVYWLGPERGLIRIDSEWLVIRFGQDSRVSNYELRRD